MDTVLDNLLSSVTWAEPYAGELEPTYTKRVIYPQVKKYVSYKAPEYAVRSDGLLRPQPITIGSHPFYPDLAVNLGPLRSLAIEVKFFSHIGDRSSLMTGLGQILLYRSFGYLYSALFLVGREPIAPQLSTELQALNTFLPDGSIVLSLS